MGVLAPNRMGGIKEGEGKENEDGEERRELLDGGGGHILQVVVAATAERKGREKESCSRAKTLNY